MTNKINLIELLSLFRPSGDFSSSNYKINVKDLSCLKVDISEPLQSFIKYYFSQNSDLIFNSPVKKFRIEPKSEILTVYIDSSIYKQSRERFVKLDTLVELLDPQQPLRVSYWDFVCNGFADLVADCFSSSIYPNVDYFKAYDMRDAFVTNLTVQRLDKNNPYMLVINARAPNTFTQLRNLSNYKKPQETPSHD